MSYRLRIHPEQERHPNYPLGLNPHDKENDQLLSLDWAAGQIPSYEPSVDRLSLITIGLDENDRLGICGPTSADNHRRIMTKVETGTEVEAPIAAVKDLYARSTHPPFDPQTNANDNGVQMPDLMAAMRDGGLDGDKIVCFARLNNLSDASIYAAIDMFGAVIFAVDLQVAQQSQTDQPNPVWDYKKSEVWGGHAIVAANYDAKSGRIDVGSWGMKVGTTPAFRAHQLGEVWIPIYKTILESNKFVKNIDYAAMAAGYTALTGGKLPAVDPTPPGPTPTPPAPGGSSFLTVGPFTDQEMVVINRRAVLQHENPSEYCTHIIKGRVDK